MLDLNVYRQAYFEFNGELIKMTLNYSLNCVIFNHYYMADSKLKATNEGEYLGCVKIDFLKRLTLYSITTFNET